MDSMSFNEYAIRKGFSLSATRPLYTTCIVSTKKPKKKRKQKEVRL